MRKFILTFACLLAVASAQTTILPKTTVLPNTTLLPGCSTCNQYVQSTSHTVTSGTNVFAITSPVSVGSGNHILVFSGLASATWTVSQTSGSATLSAWTAICANGNAACTGNASADANGCIHDVSGGSSGWACVFYAKVTGSGTVTVTQTNTGNVNAFGELGEYISPTGTYDVAATSNGNSAFNANCSSGASGSVTGAGELMVGFGVDSGSFTYTPTNALTTNTTPTGGKMAKEQTMYGLNGTSGTKTFSATLSGSANWICMGAAFK